MSLCDRCGLEVGPLYCGKCREDIEVRERGAEHLPSEDIVILLAYDRKTKMYLYGCSVKGCPCNMQNGWCSKKTPHIDKEWINLMLNMLHEYDGDNCVKQWCG